MKTYKSYRWPALTLVFVSLVITSCVGITSQIYTEEEACGSLESVSTSIPRAKRIYVSTLGDDENGDGSLNNPYLTIRCALASANPGDEIILRGEPGLSNNRYKESVRIQIPNITLRSEDGEWSVIECPVNVEEVDSCIRFDVESNGSKLLRVEVIGGYYYGIKFDTTWDWDEIPGGEGASGILIEDVRVHDTGNAAVKVTPGCDDITLRRVELYNSGRREPESAEGVDNVNGDRMTIQDSYIHDTTGTGLYCKGGAMDCLVERNRIERTGGAGILIGFDTSPEYFDLAVNPNYYENIRGVVRNNVIRDVPWAGIGLYAAKDAQVMNNTLIDTAQEVHSPIYFGLTYQDWVPEAHRPASVNITIINNLVYQSAGLSKECVFIRYDEEDELGKMSALEGIPVMDYNIYAHAAGDCVFTDMRPGNELSQGILADWQIHINGDAHSLMLDPLLILDGHIPSTSPAVDSGICVSSLVEDIDMDHRPYGTSCDIGADEFTPSNNLSESSHTQFIATS